MKREKREKKKNLVRLKIHDKVYDFDENFQLEQKRPFHLANFLKNHQPILCLFYVNIFNVVLFGVSPKIKLIIVINTNLNIMSIKTVVHPI